MRQMEFSRVVDDISHGFGDPKMLDTVVKAQAKIKLARWFSTFLGISLLGLAIFRGSVPEGGGRLIAVVALAFVVCGLYMIVMKLAADNALASVAEVLEARRIVRDRRDEERDRRASHIDENVEDSMPQPSTPEMSTGATTV